MKMFTKQTFKKLLYGLSAVGFLGIAGAVSAQTHIGRTYADVQKTNIPKGAVSGADLGAVDNPTNVIGKTDLALRDSSTLRLTSLLAGTGVTQYLEFTTDGSTPRTIPAGTKIFLKFQLDQGLLGLNLLGLTGETAVGTFTGLTGNSSDATATETQIAFSNTQNVGSRLIDLLTGAGTNEIVITAPADCNGVYIKYSALLGLGGSTSPFHAYIYDTKTGDGGCPKLIDWVSGSRAYLGINAANLTANVVNPSFAIDNDPTTAATITTGAKVASMGYLRTMLNTPAKAGDSVRIVVNNPNGGLLNLAVLGAELDIITYNGDVEVDSIRAETGSLLTLQLLPGSTDKNVISFAATGDFDRYEILYGGVVDATGLLGNGNLDVYETQVVIPAPTVSAAQMEQYIYAGNSTTLQATQNTNGDALVWLTDSAGTAAVAQPIVTTSTDAGTTKTYWAASSRNGCIDASARVKINLHILSIGLSNPTNGEVGTAYNYQLTVPAPTTTPPNTPSYSFNIPTGNSAFVHATPSLVGKNKLNTTSYNAPNLRLTADAHTAASIVGIPAGLSMSSTGLITGTPTTAGTYDFTVDVVDNANLDPSGQPLKVGSFAKSIVIASSTLPVSLTSFNATLNANKTVALNWNTASEQNSKAFNVQRSSNGTNFTTIGSVDAHGTTSVSHNYRFTDNNPGAVAYYRLQMVDNDNSTTLSKVVSVTGGSSNSAVSISPNPAKNLININASNVKSVSIFDATGRKVLTSNQTQINVSALSAGIYFVEVTTTDGSKVSSKIIKL